MFRQVALPESFPGRLYLHSMPGRYETFQEFLAEARRVGLDLVVCLAADDEVRSKSPAYAAARSARAGSFRILDFPIQDHGVPPDEGRRDLETLVRRISSELRTGRAVLVHCWMGVGRTGTVATCVLLELGLDEVTAVRAVKSAGSGAEVAAQKDLIGWYSSILHGRSGA
jgi:protein-tyrosine phosphatase